MSGKILSDFWKGDNQMKWIDCSACIGLDSINRVIVNHEDYYVHEKVRQAEHAADLLSEMDFCGVDEAFVYHQGMVENDPGYGNKLISDEVSASPNRLHATWAILPPITENEYLPERLIPEMKKNNVFALRTYPVKNRYFLDRITMGELLDAMIERNIPLYLSPQDGWQFIFDALKEFPKLTVIITNYGLWGSDRFFFPLIKAYKNVYIDTSDYQVIDGINKFYNTFGDERLLFGSNYPMDYFGGPITALISSDLPEASLEKIASGNITRIMSEVRL